MIVAFALIGLLALGPAEQDRGKISATIEVPRGPPLSGAELDARTTKVGGLLRCPVCQGLSVADSPSSMARNMKAEVREQLAKGYDEEQILGAFEHSYGEFVRLEPPRRGVNWLIWLGPLGALLAGGVVVAWALKRGAASLQPVERGAVPTRAALPEDARLAAAVRRVRELAYGWPGGLPPPDSPSRPP